MIIQFPSCLFHWSENMAGMKGIGIVDDGSNNQTQTHGKLVRRRKRHWYEKFPNWVKDYSFELAIGAATLAAIFLLVEPWNIRASIFATIRWIIRHISRAFSSFSENILANLTLSDSVAIVILLAVLYGIFWRVRWRILRSEKFWSDHCPRCDSSGLQRIRRRWYDRLLGLAGIPVRRYRCTECKWRGLRIHKSNPGHRAKPTLQIPETPVDNSLFPQ